jgi:transposase
MLTLNISEADIERAKYERLHNPLASVRKRMDVLYWTSQGNSRSKVSDISGVHRNSIVTYIKFYHEGGLNQLLSFRYKGPESRLSGHQVTLEEYFNVHPPRTAKQAKAAIKNLTGETLGIDAVRDFMHKLGMKPRKAGHIPAKADGEQQQLFVQNKINKLIEKAQNGRCYLFFMDGAHFTLLPLVQMVWSVTRIFIKAAPGRDRINVLGALDAISLQVYSVINTTYVNADTVVELLKLLSAKCKKGIPIYIILDNARYQHCAFVKTWATALGIELVFLPPYSPNLNLIERLWKFIKKEIISNHYFESAKIFHQAIVQAMFDINHCPVRKHELKSLLTLNFQSFAQILTP